MAKEKKDPLKVKAALARRDALTPERRTEIARTAARLRHGTMIKAIHKGNFKEEFGIDVECYVLDDEHKTAVISQRGMGIAIGLTEGGGRLRGFINSKTLAPHVGRELAEKLSKPLIFKWSPVGATVPPVTVHGFDVTILIDVCKAIQEAEAADALKQARYRPAIKQARSILNGSAKAGIKNLVYALAGYDATRQEVIEAFKLYVREEARTYESEFSEELYTQWYRLYELERPEKGRTWKFRHLTVDQVYTPLAHSRGKILDMTRTQKASSGKPRSKLHQFLSEIGVKALRQHLGQLLGIAQISEDKATYEKNVNKVFGVQPELDFDA